jgi:hypothetical protein
MDMIIWLRSLGLEKYEQVFRKHEIDAEALPELTELDLEKLGIPLGHHKRLFRAIAALRTDATAKAPPGDAATSPMFGMSSGEFVCRAIDHRATISSLDRGACAPTYRVCEGLVASLSQHVFCKICPLTGQGIVDDRTTHQSSIGGNPRSRRGWLFASNGS